MLTDSHKVEAFSLSNMYKYCYVLLINLYYIPDPPFFLHAILETALTHMRSEKVRTILTIFWEKGTTGPQ